jgi:hypothetical protein
MNFQILAPRRYLVLSGFKGLNTPFAEQLRFKATVFSSGMPFKIQNMGHRAMPYVELNWRPVY